jgi:DNA-binding NtrC family response regulator
MDKKLKMLYVDDEAINLDLFTINFSGKYEVVTANNAFSGMETLEKDPEIQVVISDMKMPRMNGIQFISRASEKFPDKSFFILTGFNITEEIENALARGLISDYFKKPFDINEIESAIHKVPV